MEKIIAYCGIICSECDVYKATINNDDDLRLALVKRYTTKDKTPKIEDFNCKGCFHIKDEGCKIRQCATKKEVANCAKCENYECDEIIKHFKHSPESKSVLDEIHYK